MIAEGKTGIILKAGALALMWVLIVTCTTFPQLLENPVCFLAEQISFENTGKFLLFIIGIFTFDLFIQISYSIGKQDIRKDWLVFGCLLSFSFNVLFVSFAIGTEINRICPVLLIGISVGFLKAANLYLSEYRVSSSKIVMYN
jgi:hypothetical protein